MKLSLQYPIIEASNGLLYIIIFMTNGFSVQSVLYCMMISALLVLSVIDYRTMEMPLGINLFILLIGSLLTITNYEHYISHLIGFLSVSLFLLCFFLATKGKGLGGGDVILMAGAGLGIGGINIWLALIFGCLIGSVLQVIKLILTGEGRKFALGPYLSIGIWIAMLWGNDFWEWVMRLRYR
jgi:leader peptidase (prepilin peptidase)/N-methyltransferase